MPWRVARFVGLLYRHCFKDSSCAPLPPALTVIASDIRAVKPPDSRQPAHRRAFGGGGVAAPDCSGRQAPAPGLLLLTAGALGYAGTGHHRLAAVVEFIHTATLLRDDVVDESSLRRGLPTANARFGNPASVLVGDFLYTRAFQMTVQAQDMRVMQILAGAPTPSPKAR